MHGCREVLRSGDGGKTKSDNFSTSLMTMIMIMNPGEVDKRIHVLVKNLSGVGN